MGTLVFQHDLAQRSKTHSRFRLSAIVRADSFFYLISADDAHPLRARGLSFSERFPLYDKPVGYLLPAMLQDDLLFEDFEVAVFALDNIPFLLVSSAQLQASSARALLERVTHVGPKDEVGVDRINHALHVLYAYPLRVKDEIALYFQSGQVRHLASCLVKDALSAAVQYQLTLYITDGAVSLIATHEHVVKHVRQYVQQADPDVLYFALAVSELLHWEPRQVLVNLLGPAVRESTQELLSAYFPNTQLYSTERLTEIADLMILEQCGS